jgi:hypothetical protein
MLRLTALTLLVLAGTGCGGSSSTVLDGGYVLADGLYNVQVASATGDCQPPTLTGPLRLPMRLYVGHQNQTLLVPMPGDSTEESVDRFELTNGRWDNTVNSCGATHEISIVIDVESGSRLDITRSDSWSNVAAATRGMAGCIVPASDCHTSTQLTYTFADACPEGCSGGAGSSILSDACDCSGADLGAP